MKKALVVCSLAILATGCASTAQAQEHHFFTTTDDIAYTSGSRTLSMNNGQVVTTWIKIQSKFVNKFNYDLIQVHCPTGMFRITQRQNYVNGGYSSSGYTDGNAPWQVAVPNTLGSALVNLCNN